MEKYAVLMCTKITYLHVSWMSKTKKSEKYCGMLPYNYVFFLSVGV